MAVISYAGETGVAISHTSCGRSARRLSRKPRKSGIMSALASAETCRPASINETMPIAYHRPAGRRRALEPQQPGGVVAKITFQALLAAIEPLWVITTQDFEH